MKISASKILIIAMASIFTIASRPAQVSDKNLSDSNIRDVAESLRSIADSLKTTHDAASAAPCRSNMDDRRSELCAQWKAADAAAESARIGWIGLTIGTVTLLAAIAAAVFAKRAADEARRGAEAAEQGVRCHVVIKDALLRFDSEHRTLRVEARVANDGETPARKVWLTARAKIDRAERYGPGDDEWAFGSERSRVSPKAIWHDMPFGVLLAARQEICLDTLVINFWLNEEEMASEAFLRVYVQLKITFIDVFGKIGERLENRTIEDLRPIDFDKSYNLSVSFDGGEGDEWR